MDHKIELGPDIAGRTRYSKADKSEVRAKGGEFWTVGYGDYSSFYFEPGANNTERGNEYEFKGLEIVIANQIKELLKQRTNKPVVVLDFGGMISLSFLRLAGSPEFRSFVEQGKLVFAVTNIDFTIEQGIRTAGKGLNELESEDVDFIRKNMRYVNYIKSDAAELRNVKIQNEFVQKEVPLSGNIDILCERYTLKHGVKNDVDFYLLAKMMSENGVMFIGSRILQLLVNTSREFENNRETAHKAGLQNISRAGLVEHTSKRNMHYMVYERPGGLKIEI